MTSTIFDRIAQLAGSSTYPGRPFPKWQPSVEECIAWLRKETLTRAARSYEPDPLRDPVMLLGQGNPVTLGVPSHRSERRRKAELDLLKKDYREQRRTPNLSQDALDKLWNELKNPATAIRTLDLHRLPADALAFCRPFHFSPHEEWGIYIMVERLLNYCDDLYRAFGGKLAAFNLEILAYALRPLLA